MGLPQLTPLPEIPGGKFFSGLDGGFYKIRPSSARSTIYQIILDKHQIRGILARLEQASRKNWRRVRLAFCRREGKRYRIPPELISYIIDHWNFDEEEYQRLAVNMVKGSYDQAPVLPKTHVDAIEADYVEVRDLPEPPQPKLLKGKKNVVDRPR